MHQERCADYPQAPETGHGPDEPYLEGGGPQHERSLDLRADFVEDEDQCRIGCQLTGGRDIVDAGGLVNLGGARQVQPVAGLYKAVDTENSLEIAKQRVQQAERVGSAALVSACPSCIANLWQSARRTGTSVKVMDFADIVAQQLREG